MTPAEYAKREKYVNMTQSEALEQSEMLEDWLSKGSVSKDSPYTREEILEDIQTFPGYLEKAQKECKALRDKNPCTFCSHLNAPCDRRCIEFEPATIEFIEYYRRRPIGPVGVVPAWCTRFNMPIKY